MPTSAATTRSQVLGPGQPGFDETVAIALGAQTQPELPDALASPSTVLDELRALDIHVERAARVERDVGEPLCFALVETPGATAMFTGCWQHADDADTGEIAKVTARCVAHAATRGTRIVEMLLPPGHRPASTAAELGGASHLTVLHYLRKRTDDRSDQLGLRRALTWRNYGVREHRLFVEAIKASYAQSMDCPELTGIRCAEEALAGHRAAGPFDPSLWWVALDETGPAGVLLLCEIPGAPGLELVYMGVAQPARGTGVADALIDRAARLARDRGAKFVALAVDARNVPARRLYARWNFVEIGAKEVWIALPSAAEARAPGRVHEPGAAAGEIHDL